MEMLDMGNKQETPTAVGEKQDKPKISYPGFSIRGDSIPEELKGATPEDMCRCEVLLKVVSNGIDTYNNDEPRVEVEIHKLGYLAKAGNLTKEEKLKMTPEEREKADKDEVMGQEELEGQGE